VSKHEDEIFSGKIHSKASRSEAFGVVIIFFVPHFLYPSGEFYGRKEIFRRFDTASVKTGH